MDITPNVPCCEYCEEVDVWVCRYAGGELVCANEKETQCRDVCDYTLCS